MQNIIDFLGNAIKLKSLKRAGWVRMNIPNPESVAEHSFFTAIFAYLLADELDVNRDKLVQMALIHDLAEVIVGDITPDDGVSGAEKHTAEQSAMETLTASIGNNSPIMNVWAEAEDQTSPEAKILHQLDKLEMAFQALQYEKQFKMDLSHFWKTAEGEVRHGKLREILQSLKQQRPTHF